MKNIYNFNDFMLNRNLNPVAIQYINDEITGKQFEQQLFKTNEGIGDFLSNIKGNILDVFYTFIMNPLKKNVLEKVINFSEKVLDYIQSLDNILASSLKIFILCSLVIVLTRCNNVKTDYHYTDDQLIVNQKGVLEGAYDVIVQMDMNGKNDPEMKKAINDAKTYVKYLIKTTSDSAVVIDTRKMDDMSNDTRAIEILDASVKFIEDKIEEGNSTHNRAILSAMIIFINKGIEEIEKDK